MSKDNSTRILRRLFWQLLPVQALAMGLPAINSLMNSFIVGRYVGATALAAVGFASPLNMFLSALSGNLATGSQLVCGRHLGKGDRLGIRRVFSSVVVMSLVLGFALSALVFLFPETVAKLLGAQDEGLALTSQYIRGLSVGMGFSVLLTCLLPLLQMERDGKRSSAAILAMVVVNVAGNLINALVLGGTLLGVGLSTALANVAAVAIVLPHFRKQDTVFRFSFRDFHLSSVTALVYEGMPAAVGPVCLVFRNRLVNEYVFRFSGLIGMSAMAVAGNITTAVGCVVESGYSGSVQLISSILVGQRDSKSLRELSKAMIRSIWPLFAGAYAIVFFFSKPLALLFGAEPEHLETYITFIRLFNLWYLTNIFATPAQCIYQALGKVKLMAFIRFVNNVVFPAATVLTLSSLLGVGVAVSVTWTDEVLTLLLLAVLYTVWAKRPPRSLWDLAYVPSFPGIPHENRFSATISTLEEAVAASEQAEAFCLAKGLDRKKANYCGLCIEEMTVDTIQNRFSDSSRTIDLRLIYEDGKIRILLRDDCPQFNPLAWLELCQPEDAMRSVGIRMITKLAAKMEYSSTLGLNVLNIEV